MMSRTASCLGTLCGRGEDTQNGENDTAKQFHTCSFVRWDEWNIAWINVTVLIQCPVDMVQPEITRLFNQQHSFGVDEIARRDSVKINTAGETGCIHLK